MSTSTSDSCGQWSTALNDGNDTIELATQIPLPPSSSTLGGASSLSTFASVETESQPGTDLDARSMRNEVNLAPVDGGLGAWSFLVGAFVIELIIWSFPFAFGFFLSAYLEDSHWKSQKYAETLLPLVGTLSTGLIYCSGAFLNPLLSRYPHYRRITMWLGGALCGLSLLAASYATKIFQLVITQGCLFGLGGALAYYPALSYLQEWFVRRRGLAIGIIFAATSAGGLVLPLVLPYAIRTHGTSTTLRYISIITLVSLALALPLIRPRLPENRVHGPGRRSNGNRPWLRDWSWWILLLANTLQGFAHFLPIIWLPTFASALNASSSTSSISLALLNGATVFSQLGLGLLSDYVSPWLLASLTLSAASLATFMFWGVAGHAVAGLFVFGATYGLLAGGFSSLYTAFVRPIAKDDVSLSVNLFGILLFSRGLGNVLSSPISTALSASTHFVAHEKTGFDVDNGRYGRLIIYVGTCLAGAAMVMLAGWMKEVTLTNTRSRQV
ncbi:MFS general substrate transporter, partial [Stereum hirsutum FP-91666 SS1]|uniref:MFS general substrate transporter n=1 Tax=Stereum hirsutum (strain FP-91666) TaxID=721885 RepID=UPI0004449832